MVRKRTTTLMKTKVQTTKVKKTKALQVATNPKEDFQNRLSKLKGGQILDVDLSTVADSEYAEYGVAVIEDRAIFSGIDGLKPVARRSLYAIHELGLHSSAKADKSAKAVGACYAKGTLITMSDSTEKCIETVQVGEYVKTRNGNREVTQTFNNGIRDTLRLEAANGKILVLTPEELVWALCPDGEQRWVAASDLTMDHAIATL